eukprot:TRINITY_DN36430_c0_g1_i3.p1 TRINITY_DN36430_c0_g1~~TRINITY_DN36430_c0_g1_i3.p1  ORF type:complete len:171 (+),score=28.19 TRINITY_DN36430_c0_g1_i3:50-562(+)
MFVFFFFFFKQKTAYEIMPSLVGSEMCIRDRCNNDKPVKRNNALWKEIDLLKQKYGQSYINCPDSAEKIAFRMLHIFDSIGENMERLNTYDKLSDLYQYRKKDDIKALDCMTKALEIYSKHPDLPLENPYFFINNANILYRNKLYDHAIELYKQSYTCLLYTSPSPRDQA